MEQLLIVIVGFLLTGLIGNRLLQKWQDRSWLHHQQILGHEKEFISLRELAEQLARDMGSRLFHMKRLLMAVRSLSKAEIEDRLRKYDQSNSLWNESLSAYYVRLTFYAHYHSANRLETQIQKAFVKAGFGIERLVRKRRTDAQIYSSEVTTLDEQLNSLQASVFNYNRDLLREVEQKRVLVYFGRAVPYTEDNLKEFSTWDLIKALFVSNVDRHSVIRPPIDPVFPDGVFR